MKDTKKSDSILLAFTATVAPSLTVVDDSPETPEAEEKELTDEELDAIADRPLNPVSQFGYDLLEAIHSEEPHFEQVQREAAREAWHAEERKREAGLTTEINTSKSLVSVSDTMENVAALFRRHPHGFRFFVDEKGRKSEPYTEAENKAAEEWLAAVSK